MKLQSMVCARFSFFRYGLTSMAKTQAGALREGVERYRDDDITVKVFEMTLRNEVRNFFFFFIKIWCKELIVFGHA